MGTEGVKKTKEKSKKDKKNMKTLNGDKESKKTMNKGVDNGSGTEECNGHFGEGDGPECGKGFENSGISEGKNRTSKAPDELQNRTDDSAVGLDRNVMTGKAFESAEKEERKKRKRKKDKSIEQDIFEKKDPQGERVEAVDKEEKRNKKRKRDASIVSEGDMQGNDLTSQSNDVTKDEKKRKKKNKKGKGEGSGAGTTMDLELDLNDGTKGKKGKAKSDDVGSEDPRPKKSKNRVSFSGKDKVFQSEENLVQGNDFTSQSDFVTKDEKKRKKKNKKGKGESGASAGTTMDLELDLNEETKGKKGKAKSDDVGSEDPKPKRSKKKVSFSGKDEVLQSEEKLVQGKRFSKEEDEMVKEAVLNYIEVNGLGEEGLQMILKCKSNPKTRNCWKEIAKALPHRPKNAVYYRAHCLFQRDEKRKWTEEEIEILRESQKKNGNKWTDVADELGKHRYHVKDTWRRIRHENLKKGQWSQDEYQTLFDLVNADLRMKYAEEKKSKHGMLRDNVPWAAISDRLTTRTDPACCMKWYRQLTSPMVVDGEWADSDDYRLIDALYELDASCYEDVDWDRLIEHRSGTICEKRWSEMVLHIGDSSNRSFADQVEVLTKRYCPELLDAKEDWESKPVVGP